MVDTSALGSAVRRAVERTMAEVAPGSSWARAHRARTPVSQAPTGGALPFLRIGARGPERLDLMMQATLRHGHVVRYELPWVTAHVLTHPEQVEEILITRHRSFDKRTRGYDKLRDFLGEGLLTSDGEHWLRQRRIAAPAFHKKRIDGFANTMAECTEAMLARWRTDGLVERDLATEMMRLTLQIAARTLLSADTEKQQGTAESIGRSVTVLLHEANRRISNVLTVPDAIPTAGNRRLRQARETLDGTVHGIIAERRAAIARGDAESAPSDLLQMFIEATDAETGERMNDKQVRDEVMTMFLAGHETTANALAWSFYLLGQRPAIARALHDEAVQVLGDRLPTAEDVPKLELARRVFAEAMRLYPPVWVVGRGAVEPLTLGGFGIPERSVVFLCPWITHRHPDFWDEPEAFEPDRFAPGVQLKFKHQYFPFIAGPRMCIGAGFAQMEGVLVLAQVMRRVRLPLVPGHRVEPDPVVTLRPKGGVWARTTFV